MRRTAISSGSPARRRSARAPTRSAAPDLVGDLHHAPQLGHLLLVGEGVALDGGREAALRREAQLVDVDVLRGLLDAALELFAVLQRARLRRDEAQDHHLALGHEAQWLEAAAARVV